MITIDDCACAADELRIEFGGVISEPNLGPHLVEPIHDDAFDGLALTGPNPSFTRAFINRVQNETFAVERLLNGPNNIHSDKITNFICLEFLASNDFATHTAWSDSVTAVTSAIANGAMAMRIVKSIHLLFEALDNFDGTITLDDLEYSLVVTMSESEMKLEVR